MSATIGDNGPEKADTHPQNEEMKKYGYLLKKQIAPLKIQAANEAGDRVALENAISNMEVMGLEKTREAKDAKYLLEYIHVLERDLEKACKERNRDEIVAILEHIRKEDFPGKEIRSTTDIPLVSLYLRDAMEEAQRLVHQLTVRNAIPTAILSMDRKTMMEMKSYQKPTPLIHRVMQAIFLLFNEDEDITSDWNYCQKLLTPDGPQGLNRKMMAFDPEKVDHFIVKRVEYMLQEVDLHTVRKASPGAATFYIWAMSMMQSRFDEEEAVASTDMVTPRQFNGVMTQSENVKRQYADFMKIIRREKKIFEATKRQINEEKKTTRKQLFDEEDKTTIQPLPYYNIPRVQKQPIKR